MLGGQRDATDATAQVMTDRFALADESYPACDPAAAEYCGGTWRGLEKHLDYIQGMGFDAIWISPVAKNIDGHTDDGQGYHGCVSCRARLRIY